MCYRPQNPSVATASGRGTVQTREIASGPTVATHDQLMHGQVAGESL